MNDVLQNDWIMSYVAGVLNPGESLMVETYIAARGEDGARLDAASEIAGAFLESVPVADVSASLRDETLRKLDTPFAYKGSDVGSNPSIDAIMRGKIDEVPWSFLGPGLRKHKVWSSSEGGALWLLRAEPGTKIPDHTHSGTELTLVLRGSYRDATGSYNEASLQEADESLEHELEIMGRDECICLALTESPIVIKSWSGRFLQKLVGF